MLYSNYLRDKSQNAIKIKEAEGNPCVIEKSKGRNLKDYKIYGNSYQATRGKNLWDEKQDFSFTGNGTQVGTSLNLSTSFKSNTQYTISLYFTASDITFSEEGNLVFLNISYTDGSSQYAGITSYNYTQGVALVTTLSGKSVYKIANITPHARFSSGTINIQKIQLEEGAEATSYEQYKNMPSVEFPSEVQSVGDLTTKNLLPNDWENGFISTTSGNNQSSSIYVRTKDYFTLDISKNYYISSDSIDTRTTISWYFYDENKNFISRFVSYKDRTIGTSDCNVTVPANAVFFRLAVLTTDITIKVQIEEGLIATEYEPYHKYDIPITVRGKNLIDVSALSNIDNYFNAKEGRGGLEFFNVKFPAGTYTASVNIIDTPIGSISATYVQDNIIYPVKVLVNTTDTQGEKNITFTMPQDWYIRLYFAGNSNTSARLSALIACIDSMQLEYGSIATFYEPYNGGITEHIYLDEPLRKVGDYADYIDFKNQKVIRKIYECNASSMSYTIQNISTKAGLIRTGLFSTLPSMIKGTGLSGFCNVLPIDKSGWDATKVEAMRFGQNNRALYVYTKNTYSSKEELLDYLGDTRFTYILEIPIETSISLPEIPTIKGVTNVIELTTSIQPSNMNVKYIRT